MDRDYLGFDNESIASGAWLDPVHSTEAPIENLLGVDFSRDRRESTGINDIGEQVRLLSEANKRLEREQLSQLQEQIKILTMENTSLREQVSMRNSEEERGRSRDINMVSSRRLPTMQDHLELQDQNLSRLQATNVSHQHHRNLIKPKDIPLLKMGSMSLVTSKQLVQRFLSRWKHAQTQMRVELKWPKPDCATR